MTIKDEIQHVKNYELVYETISFGLQGEEDIEQEDTKETTLDKIHTVDKFQVG